MKVQKKVDPQGKTKKTVSDDTSGKNNAKSTDVEKPGKVLPAENVTQTLPQNNGKNDARKEEPQDEITPVVPDPDDEEEEELEEETK